jgi:ketosteroid isomerase-like protein
MNLNNNTILEKANFAITKGDNEGFLAFCTDDMEWTFVGDKIPTRKGSYPIVHGKDLCGTAKVHGRKFNR